MSIDLPGDIYDEETPLKIYRIHDKDRDPIFFGRTCRYRFDDPEKVFGVLYAAVNREGAFVEAVLRQKLGHRPQVSYKYLEQRKLSVISLKRPAKVAMLHGPGLAANWANAEVTSSGDYKASQPFSAALHGHSASLDGISYRCRHDDSEVAFALFDRCRDVISSVEIPAETLDLYDDWLQDLERRYRVVFIA